MSEPAEEIETPDGLPFLVYGLLGGNRAKVDAVVAIDEADARAQYHQRYPGWEGTIFKVEQLVLEGSDDDD